MRDPDTGYVSTHVDITPASLYIGLEGFPPIMLFNFDFFLLRFGDRSILRVSRWRGRWFWELMWLEVYVSEA